MYMLEISELALILLLILVIYNYIITPIFFSPLSKIPRAHWSSPFSPAWILWIRYRERENRVLHAAHLKHGPIIRLGPMELSINDVAGIKAVYTGGFDKGSWYGIFDNYGVPCAFSSKNSRQHSARKRMTSNAYSKSTVQSSNACVRQAQVILHDRLLPYIFRNTTTGTDGNTAIDVLDLWNASSMDMITSYIFGLKNACNFIENIEQRKRWLDLYFSRKTYTYFSQELPGLTRLLKRIYIHLVPTWVDDANRELEAFTKDSCDATADYLKETSFNSDSESGNAPIVFKALLSGMEKEYNLKADDSVIFNETLRYPELSVSSEVIDNLAAGQETSGITLTYLSWHLSQDVRLQDALRSEILCFSQDFVYSATNSRQIPNLKALDTLPLLHAVLMETLRLNAAIPGSQPRVTPFPCCSIGPYPNIPGGVRISARAHNLHRNADVFLDPEKWDHNRWMDHENSMSVEQRQERDRWFWAFSSGGRMCIGSNFAMQAMKLTIAAVYSNFRTHIVDDTGIEQIDGYTCGPKSNRLLLRFEWIMV